MEEEKVWPIALLQAQILAGTTTKQTHDPPDVVVIIIFIMNLLYYWNQSMSFNQSTVEGDSQPPLQYKRTSFCLYDQSLVYHRFAKDDSTVFNHIPWFVDVSLLFQYKEMVWDSDTSTTPCFQSQRGTCRRCSWLAQVSRGSKGSKGKKGNKGCSPLFSRMSHMWMCTHQE